MFSNRSAAAEAQCAIGPENPKETVVLFLIGEDMPKDPDIYFMGLSTGQPHEIYLPGSAGPTAFSHGPCSVISTSLTRPVTLLLGK